MSLRKLTGRSFAFLLSLLLVFQTLIFFPIDLRADSIDDFVTRCYKIAFERDPDESGFNYWKDQLTGRKIDGSVTAFDFIFSNEYLAQQTSDEQYIKDLYEMFMGREPDADGYAYWTQALSQSNRQSVFEGFANSQEFYDICSGYNIPAGFYTQAFPLEQINNVNLFVDRMYRTTLGRIGDRDGQIYWTNGLLTGRLTGCSCAENFIFSPEYTSKDLSIENYIKDLYLAFMGREADDAGLQYWLNSGLPKNTMFYLFTASQEFAEICQDYGIVNGINTIASIDPSASEEDVARFNIVKSRLDEIDGVCVNPDFAVLEDGSLQITFEVEQPVDWDHPEGAKFRQHVYLQFRDDGAVNVCYVGGYEGMFIPDIELATIYNANCFMVEHRFYGSSVPKDFETDSSKYWKYLTYDQAAKDFHHIIEIAKEAFNGKWIFTGGSKGGFITNYQSATFPGDADVYVAYVAPIFKTTDDKGLMDYIFDEIGTERFGDKEAAHLRELSLNYVLMMLEHRDLAEEGFCRSWQYDGSIAKKNGITQDEFYDYHLMMNVTFAWQYNEFSALYTDIVEKYIRHDPTYLDDLKKIYEEEDIEPDPEVPDEIVFPFNVECFTQIGRYTVEFKRIRDELKARGSSAYVAVKEKDEATLYQKVNVPNEISAQITYDDSSVAKLNEWIKTTNSTVIMLYGSSDIYTFFRFPETDNPNVHFFTAKNKAHDPVFSDTEVWPEVQKILDSKLK